jgi:hypothetical protein
VQVAARGTAMRSLIMSKILLLVSQVDERQPAVSTSG